MSFKSNESKYALDVVSDIAGKPADIKRIGPVSLDLCKVADGTYDAYFEHTTGGFIVLVVLGGFLCVGMFLRHCGSLS